MADQPITGNVVSMGRTPAYVSNNPQASTMDKSPNANLSVFANPIEGHVDTGVTHDGDLGGTA